MTLREAITRGKATLAGASIDCADPSYHMKHLASYVLRMPMTRIYLDFDNTLSKHEVDSLSKAVALRASGLPLQYVVGACDFWKSSFFVGPGVLIPRPETERLLEVLLAFEQRSGVHVAELGAGSGNIGLSALHERPEWIWSAYESSSDAFRFCHKNWRSMVPISRRFNAMLGDFFVEALKRDAVDWIVSNPPYLPTKELLQVSREVQSEPRLALDGGSDGLAIIQRLIAVAPFLLRRPGGLLLEFFSEQQIQPMRQWFKESGASTVEIFSDLAHTPRVALGTWR